MPLRLRRMRDQNPQSVIDYDDDHYAVLSGEMLIGIIKRPHRGEDAPWQWSITGIYAVSAGIKDHGIEPSKDAAKAALAESWRQWLAWAGLKEVVSEE